MGIDFKTRENEIKNSYTIKVADGEFILMQKDFYFSDAFNDYQDYWKIYKPYKTLGGAISGLKKLVAQHFPADYFKHNDINDIVKTMIQ